MDRRRYCVEVLQMERTGRRFTCPQLAYPGSDRCYYHRSLAQRKNRSSTG